MIFLSNAGPVKSSMKLGGLSSKAKYFWRSIVNKYREGKVKSSPEGRLKVPETLGNQRLGGPIQDRTNGVPIEEWTNEFKYIVWLSPMGRIQSESEH